MNEYTYTQVDLKTLDSHSKDLYSSLTDPQFRCCLDGRSPHNMAEAPVFAFAAHKQEIPVGLILGSFFPATRITQVHSIYVAEKSRNQHIATNLFAHFEQLVSDKGCQILTHQYPLENALTPILEHIFSLQKWENKLFSIHCHFDQSFSAPWMKKRFVFPDGFEEFLWSSLTNEERQKLLWQEQQGVFPTELSPFRDEEHFEPLNSLGLRYKGEVIGWMVTHRIKPDTIKYSALYIQKDLESLGVAVHLLRDSINRNIHSSIPYATLDVNIEQSSPRWLAFIDKNIVPYTTSTTHTKQAWKCLRMKDEG